MQYEERTPEDGAPSGGLSKWILVLSTAFVILIALGSAVLVGARASTGIPEFDAVKRNWKGLMVLPALFAHWALYYRARRGEGGGGAALGTGAAVIGLFALTYWRSDLWYFIGWKIPAAGFAIWFAAIVVRLTQVPVVPAELPSEEEPRLKAPERKLGSAGPVRTAFRYPPQGEQLEWWRHFVVLGVIGLILFAIGRAFIGPYNPNDLSVVLYMYLGGLFVAYSAVATLAFAFLRDNSNQAALAYVLSVFVMGGIVALMA